MVLVPKTTVVDGEKEVKREEPDEGEEVDIGNESSEQPCDVSVNETTPTSEVKRRVRKTDEQLTALFTAFQQDRSIANNDRCVDLCAITGLDAQTIRHWFGNQRRKVAKEEKKQKPTETAVPVDSPTTGRTKKKRMLEVEKREEEDLVETDGNKTKKQKIVAQKSPKKPKISHNVKPAESGSGGDSGASITGWFKKKKESGVAVKSVVVTSVGNVDNVEKLQESGEDDVVVVGVNNNTVKENDVNRATIVPSVTLKVEPPAMENNGNENHAEADTVSPLDTKLIPPAVFIACRDRENSDKGKPKQCALCLEDKPTDSVTSLAEAAQLDAQFGSNLTGFLKYGASVLICDYHLTDFYDLKKIMRPEPVTTVSPRPTKCIICGGERIASVSIVSLKEAANLDEYYGSKVFDALHFSFAVKVCRMHREDLDRYQKAISNQQL